MFRQPSHIELVARRAGMMAMVALLAAFPLAGCHDVPVDPETSHTYTPPTNENPPTAPNGYPARRKNRLCFVVITHGRAPARVDSMLVDASKGLDLAFEPGTDSAHPAAVGLQLTARFPFPDTSRIPEAGFGTRAIRQIYINVPRTLIAYGPGGIGTSVINLDKDPLDDAGIAILYQPRGSDHPVQISTGEREPRGISSGELRIESLDPFKKIIRATLRARFYSDDGSPMRDVVIDKLAILIEY